MDSKLVETNSDISNTLALDLLIFKEETRLEVWKRTDEKMLNLTESFLLEKQLNWPIGLFEWEIEDETGIHLKFPSPFYKQKLAIKAIPNHGTDYPTQLNQALTESDLKKLVSLMANVRSGRLLILPNKPAKNAHFKASINAPHWTAELYAMMELELKKYPLKYGD